ADASSDMDALNAVLTAPSGIGTSTNALETTLTKLEAAIANGGIWLRNTGALTIGEITAMVGVSAHSNVDISTASPLTVSEAIDSDLGPVLLGATDDITVSAAITSGGGIVTLTAGDDIIFDSDGSIDNESGASTVTLTANSDATGGGAITMADGSFVDATDGLIWVTATGDIVLSLLRTSTDVFVLSASGGIFDNSTEAAANVLDVIAANALLRGATGIGTITNPLEIAVAKLEGTGGSGGIFIVDTGGLQIGGITSAALPGAATTAGLLANGAISVTTTGYMAIVENVVSTAGAVTLQAIDSSVTTAPNVVIPDDSGALGTSASDGSTTDEDLSVTNAAAVTAGGTVTLLAGDDLLIDLLSVITGGTQITLRGDHGNADPLLGTRIDVLGSLAAPTILVTGERQPDVFYLHPQALSGHVQVQGDVDGLAGGNDIVILDRLPNVDTAHKLDPSKTGAAALVTGREATPLRNTVDVDGRGGSDHYVIYVTGTSDYIVNVHDTGGLGDGSDTLTVNGATTNDVFLLRANFLARLQPIGQSATAFGPNYERVNYDATVNVLEVNGNEGDDRFYSDDNSGITTIDGGAGADFFQVGQLFGTDRTTPDVATGDEIATVLTTRGFLSRGISFAATIYGGEGDDQFAVYSNQAPLSLFGEAGNDTFIVRAFVLAATGQTASDHTSVSGGEGDDHVEYNVNAPVDIDGGEGVDTMVVIGTEVGDQFVITRDSVQGAGLNVFFVAVERVEVDGMEGNDHFYVLSTDPRVVTTIIGGIGSDTIDVGGDVTGLIQALSIEGTSGVVNHPITSTDPLYNNIPGDGVQLNVAGPGAGTVIVTQSGGSTTVLEDGGTAAIDSYTIRLAVGAPSLATLAFLTIAATQPSSRAL
ncbi:MAG: hypothetical protein QOI98_3526, partial [Solirubrobacteraceae bacterium]|nr:hypothetical protein [Solirubrobacteraceae bacterium]